MSILKRINSLICKLISYKTVMIILATYIYIKTTNTDWKSFLIYVFFLLYTISIRELIKILKILKGAYKNEKES